MPEKKQSTAQPHTDTSAKDRIAHTMGLHSPFPKRIAEKQRPKVGVLAGVTIAVSGLMWFFLRGLLAIDIGGSSTFDVWFWALGTFLLFFLMIALAAIVALLVHEALIARSIFVLGTLTHLMWFQYGWYTFFSIILVLCGFWLYDWQIKEEESLRIKYSTAKSMRHGLNAVIALVLLAASLTFYAKTISAHQVNGSSLNPIAELGGNTANQVLSLQVPNYDPKQTVDEFLFSMISAQAEKSLEGQAAGGIPLDNLNIDLSKPSDVVDQIAQLDLGSLLAVLPEDARERVSQDPEELTALLADQSAAAFRREYERTRSTLLVELGIRADGDTPIGDVVKQLFADQMTRFLGPYEFFLPPLLALTVFFSLSVFTFLYAACIKLTAVALFGLIKALKLVEIRTVTTEVEVAMLSE